MCHVQDGLPRTAWICLFAPDRFSEDQRIFNSATNTVRRRVTKPLTDAAREIASGYWRASMDQSSGGMSVCSHGYDL